jgi:hypothetical protein
MSSDRVIGRLFDYYQHTAAAADRHRSLHPARRDVDRNQAAVGSAHLFTREDAQNSRAGSPRAGGRRGRRRCPGRSGSAFG